LYVFNYRCYNNLHKIPIRATSVFVRFSDFYTRLNKDTNIAMFLQCFLKINI